MDTDKELRHQILDLLIADDTGEFGATTDFIMSLVLADRHHHIALARLEERRLLDADINGKTFSDATNWRDEYNRLAIKNRDAITEIEKSMESGEAKT